MANKEARLKPRPTKPQSKNPTLRNDGEGWGTRKDKNNRKDHGEILRFAQDDKTKET